VLPVVHQIAPPPGQARWGEEFFRVFAGRSSDHFSIGTVTLPTGPAPVEARSDKLHPALHPPSSPLALRQWKQDLMNYTPGRATPQLPTGPAPVEARSDELRTPRHAHPPPPSKLPAGPAPVEARSDKLHPALHPPSSPLALRQWKQDMTDYTHPALQPSSGVAAKEGARDAKMDQHNEARPPSGGIRKHSGYDTPDSSDNRSVH
jgi:hypothetical protein